MTGPVRLRDAAGWLKQESWVKWLAFSSALAVASALLLLRFLSLLEPLEFAAYDRALAIRSSSGGASEVVVVTIGDDDLKAWGWPISDGRLAGIGKKALSAGAVLVGFDIYRDIAVAPGTDELSALFKDRRVAGISKLSSSLSAAIPAAPDLLGEGRYGYSDLIVDADGEVRRALLLVQENDQTNLSFALKLALMAQDGAGLQAVRNDPRTLMIGPTIIPRLRASEGGYAAIDSRGYQILIDYRHPVESISIIPASLLLAEPSEANRLAGKIVLVGTVSETVKDMFLTPLAWDRATALTPGVAIHGAILDQILRYQQGQSRPTRSLPSWVESIAIVLFALGGALAAFTSHGILRLILTGPIAATLIVVAGLPLLLLDWWLPSIILGLSWFLSFLAVTAEISLIAGRHRRQLFSVFSTQVSPGVADEIWRNRDVFLAGGKPRPMRLDVTVMFIDIAGSTKRGGMMEPQAFVDWVGRFLGTMAGVAAKFGGFVEKFTGDGLMVVFGAPIARISAEEIRADAERACSCGLAMVAAVETLNAQAAPGANYAARIGVHSGGVLGGVFGDQNRQQYSVIGDAANLAARMETFGKRLPEAAQRPVVICISEDTVARLEPIWQLKPAGTYSHDDGVRQIAVYLLTGRTQTPED